MHCWLHDNKLGESNRLTTYPLSCLFSRVVKYDERENLESVLTSAKKTAIAWKKKSFNEELHFIAKPVLSEIPIKKN